MYTIPNTVYYIQALQEFVFVIMWTHLIHSVFWPFAVLILVVLTLRCFDPSVFWPVGVLTRNQEPVLAIPTATLQCRHNERNGVSNHTRLDCLLDRLFRRRSKKTSKLRVTGLCAGNSPVTGEFPAQNTSNAENVSIWWRHHVIDIFHCASSAIP